MKVIHVLNRFYVNNIEEAIKFYEKILNIKSSSRFKYVEMGLELASVGNILVIAGTDEALKPFRETSATFLVDSISEFKDYFLMHGVEIIRDIKKVPTGFNMTVKHPDGTIVEYVEHKADIDWSFIE